MKRVLFYSPGGVKNISGGEVSLLLIIKSLTQVKPLVLLDGITEFHKNLEGLGIPVFTLEKPSLKSGVFKRVITLFRMNYHVFRVIRDKKIAIVHANNSEAMQNAILACMLTGTRIVFNIRGTPKLSPKWQLFLLLSHRVITNSGELSTHVVKNTWRVFRSNIRKKTKGVYSGIDLSSEFKPDQHFREQHGIGNECQIGMVGAVRPLKRQLELIKYVVPEVVKIERDVVFNIIGSADYGDEHYMDACQQMARDLNIEKYVRFIPFNKSMPDWYHVLDFLVLVSKKEGLARVMIEGMSYGTPMISFAVSSAKEILESSNSGVVVNQNDFEGMTGAIIELVRNQKRLKEFGGNAKLFVRENFDIQVTAKKYEEVYLDI